MERSGWLRREKRKTVRWFFMGWLILGISWWLDVAAGPMLGWHGWRPSFLIGLLVQLSWMAGRGINALGAALVLAILLTLSVEPVLLVFLWIGATVVLSRISAHWFDVTFWIIQPLAAFLVLLLAEVFLGLNQYLYFDRFAWTPLGVLVTTSLLVPLYKWPIERVLRGLGLKVAN